MLLKKKDDHTPSQRNSNVNCLDVSVIGDWYEHEIKTFFAGSFKKTPIKVIEMDENQGQYKQT